MYKALRTYATIVLLMFSLPALAEEVARVTLENGTTVKLNDDFTWEYVILESQINADTAVAVTSPAIVAGSASAAMQTTLPASAEILTSNAMAQAALLKSTAKRGVKVSLLNSQWDDDGRLGLTFELASTSPKHFVMIELEVSLFADSGTLLQKETAKVWQAISRMPDTYLRNGQARESRIFWIEGINKSQWAKRLISLKIKEMDSRM